MTTEPRLGHRPSYAQREAYREALSDAYGEGRLDDATFAARSARADTAESLAGLENLVADLPRDAIPTPLTDKQARTRAAAVGCSGSGGAASGGAASRGGRVVRVLLVIAAVLLGGALGTGYHRAHADGTDDSAGGIAVSRDAYPDVAGAARAGYLSYGYLKGVLDTLGDKRVSSLTFGWTEASADVIVPDGKKSRGVTFDADLKQSDSQGGGTDFSADEADFVAFGATDLDPRVLYAAVQQAPALVAKRADGLNADELVTTYVIVRRTQATPTLGMKKNALTLRVMVEKRGSDNSSGGSAGWVEWSADGKHLVGVSAE